MLWSGWEVNSSRIIAFPGNNPSCTIYTDEDLRGIIADSRGFWSIEEMKGESATRISRKQTLKILGKKLFKKFYTVLKG